VFTRQVFTFVAALAIASASLSADVTIVTTMSMEGGMPGMAGQKPPQMVTHIKGMRSATVIDTGTTTMTNIVDLANRRVIVLNSQDKTAQVFDSSSPRAEKTLPMPEMDFKLRSTGKSRQIRGVECSEHVYEITINMDQMMGGAQVPPEAGAMLAGVSMRMDGSIWAAPTGPGAAEYMAFMKAAQAKDIMELMSAMTGLAGGLDQMMSATAQAPGIPYVTEVTMTAEGTGPMVDMIRQMGSMKMKMEVTSITTDPVADSMFEIPEGYRKVDLQR
jgi:hypothetical protein